MTLTLQDIRAAEIEIVKMQYKGKYRKAAAIYRRLAAQSEHADRAERYERLAVQQERTAHLIDAGTIR